MSQDWKDILAGLHDNCSDNPQDSGEATGADTSERCTDANESENSAGSADAPVSETITVFYEKKGRAGKPATIITGFDPDDPGSLERADALASALKKRLGCGGSSRGGEILLQGDRRPQLRQVLAALGYNKIKGIK